MFFNAHNCSPATSTLPGVDALPAFKLRITSCN